MQSSPNPWLTPAGKSAITLETAGFAKSTRRSRSTPKQRGGIRKISTLARGDDLAFAGALPASPALLRERDAVVTYQHDMDPDELLLRLVDMHGRSNDDEVAQRFEELEALRSRKPVFRRIRQLQDRNRDLENTVDLQAHRIKELEWQLAMEKQTTVALKSECELVREATENMVRHIGSEGDDFDASTDDAPPATGDAVTAAEIEHAGTDSWIWKGVCRVFQRFDKNGDGLLDVVEMNALQRALGNNATYDESAYRNLCKALKIKWVALPGNAAGTPGGLVDSRRVSRTAQGINAEGLLEMYRRMGFECLLRDMSMLGIPQDKAKEQLESLRRTVKHLEKLEARTKASGEIYRQLKSDTNTAQDALAKANREIDALRKGRADDATKLESLRARVFKAEHDADAALKARADGESTKLSLSQQVTELQGALQEMARLLKERLDEKHDLQRRLWFLEKKYASFSTVLRESQMTVWKSCVKSREQGKWARMLHMKLRQHGDSAGLIPDVQDAAVTDVPL